MQKAVTLRLPYKFFQPLSPLPRIYKKNFVQSFDNGASIYHDRSLNQILIFILDLILNQILILIIATTYIELWKRRQAILQWEWDLEDNADAEELRPEYESQVKTTR
jgi:hypothetical protein